ncbi:hypothetical protein SAMN04489761_2626 [Tenacibaculum sp. MAR_2009_124]|uniref:hypothetical protein n=1 Tax=Tenacibaculum sp. MAR_2009_124 TaxID=1250059 RepID=UPI0008949F38|nr:hypothetical protein [Tenacibaculum sp. MAR_2009_124]SEC30404.1 hypothetical protein SAMN04489761_2626 [Tenacibaculum sp. MAR_2009_124]
MKTLMCLVLFLTSIFMKAQETPEPPQPPTEVHSATEGRSYSYNTSTKRNKRNSSSSISVKSTNTIYKFRASFNNEVTADVRNFLQNKFKEMKFTNSNGTSFWSVLKNNEEAFKCRVSEGVVRIYVDKEMTSTGFQERIVAIGKELKYVINGESVRESEKARKESAKRRLERAKREYERAERNYERIKK